MPADTPVCICKFSPENTELCRNEAKASWVPPTDRPQYRHMLLLPIFKQFDKIVYCHIYKIYCFFMSHDAVQKVLFGSSLMVRGVFLSSCIPDSCLGIKKVCCLFPADINFHQFIGLLFPVSFFHPTPDVWVGSRPSCSIFLFHPSEASLMTQIDKTVSDPGSTAKFGMQLHLHAAPRKMGQGELAIAVISCAHWEWTLLLCRLISQNSPRRRGAACAMSISVLIWPSRLTPLWGPSRGF